MTRASSRGLEHAECAVLPATLLAGASCCCARRVPGRAAGSHVPARPPAHSCSAWTLWRFAEVQAVCTASLRAETCLMSRGAVSSPGCAKSFALPEASARSSSRCAKTYPNSPKLSGLGSGPAELSQLETGAPQPSNSVKHGVSQDTPERALGRCSTPTGAPLTAGAAQPVQRAGPATVAAQVTADPRVKAQLALCPPPDSGSFSPSAAGSSGPGFPCRRSPLFLQPAGCSCLFLLNPS